MKSVAVIGGGITGVTTAYALARRGLQVTLFERHRYPAMETSFANGGQLSASHAEAWNSWGTVGRGLQWMLRGDAPLLVSPKPSWHKLSWFAEFMAAIPRYEANTIASTRPPASTCCTCCSLMPARRMRWRAAACRSPCSSAIVIPPWRPPDRKSVV